MAKNAKMKYEIETAYVPGLPRTPYRKGKPEGVVMHETANPNSTIDGEIAYMTNNWGNAFVHAWAGNRKIVETANTDYIGWGAGPYGNARFIHIELVRYKNKQDALDAIDRWCFYTAYQLYWYDLPANDADLDGMGTIWSHKAVSDYLGGTDHTDPIEYLKQWGIKWSEVADKVIEYHEALEDGDSTKVLAIGEKKKIVVPKKPKAVVVKKLVVPNSYKSKKGETLASIAKKYGITVSAIKSFNSKLPDNIKEGTFMYLKKQSTYEVQKGDTLYKIAKKHGVGVYDLMDWNAIKSSEIKPGTILKVKAPSTKKVTVKRKPVALSAAKAEVTVEKRTAKLTQIEAVKFAQASVGKYFDYDGKFKYQCFDWANAYWHEMFNHGFTGMEAANIPTNNKDNLDLEATVYEKTDNNRPQPGDVLIWDWTPWEHEDFGHVAVALKCGTNGMTVIEQNSDGKADKPVNMRTCNYNGVTHFIRPNYKK